MSDTATEQPDDAEAASAAGAVELTARIAAIRAMLQVDPAGIGPLLQTAGAGMAPKLLFSPHAPTTLALLDELETLVELLTEAHAGVALELSRQGRRRQALGAYRSGRAGR
jgi:hypothetical protein